jgi:Tfp pilus assembly protein PilP
MRAPVLVFLIAIAGAAFSAGSAGAAAVIPEEVTRIRDPFKKPTIKKSVDKPRSDLEMYSVDQFKLVGVVTGPRKLRAMIKGPNEKAYFVAEGMAIGQRKGVISKITTTSLTVRERIVNVLGQEEAVDTQLLLPEEGKGAAGPAGIGPTPPGAMNQGGTGG